MIVSKLRYRTRRDDDSPKQTLSKMVVIINCVCIKGYKKLRT